MGGAEGKVAYIGTFYAFQNYGVADSLFNPSDTEGTFRPERWDSCLSICFHPMTQTGSHKLRSDSDVGIRYGLKGWIFSDTEKWTPTKRKKILPTAVHLTAKFHLLSSRFSYTRSNCPAASARASECTRVEFRHQRVSASHHWQHYELLPCRLLRPRRTGRPPAKA